MADWYLPSWLSGTGGVSAQKIAAKYGLEASLGVANIESLANQNMNKIMAEANVQGFQLSKDAAYRQALAQETTAWLNKVGVVESADRYALAQEMSARMNKEGVLGSAELTAFAQRFTATETANAQKYTADQSTIQAIKYASAQEFTASQQRFATEFASRVEADAQIKSTDRSSRAQEYTAQRTSQAEEYKARKQLQETQRMAKAQEYSSKAQMDSQIGSSGIQASSNVVTSGFGSFNASQRMFNQAAIQNATSNRGLVENVFLYSGLFLVTMLVLFVAMDILGIPVLATLSNIVAEAGARAVGFVEIVRNGGTDAGSVFKDSFASIGASIGGMLTALWDKLQDFFDWCVESLTGMMQKVQGYF